MEGEGTKCVKKLYIPTLKTESEELSSHTLHPPKGHNKSQQETINSHWKGRLYTQGGGSYSSCMSNFETTASS